MHRLLTPAMLLATTLCGTVARPAEILWPVVEVEEEVYRYDNANNGAGPFWCFGSTCIARAGDDVLVSGLEVIKGAKPLNNTRWLLYKRGAAGWELQQKDEKGRTREPCPIGVFPDGSVFLSVNPTLAPVDQYAGPAQPQILRFSSRSPRDPFETIIPQWDGSPTFTEHSYRSFAIDAANREMILFQNIGYTHAEWTFRDRDGKWIRRGKLVWPWGADYEKPQPIRVCYPSVQLKNRAVYFCGVSDIVEPNDAWRAYKVKLTGQQWDYDFRRLFFTWTTDITTGQFQPWVEIASREKTAGWVLPCDLRADDAGRVHLLWTERAIDVRLRKQFFPDEKQSESLHYAIVENGKVVHRQAIVLAREEESGETPGRAQFHQTPDGRLFVFFYVSGKSAGNRLVELRPDRTISPAVAVPLKTPMATFFAAGVRGGSPPSNVIDVLGESGRAVRYARLRLAK